MSQYFRYPAQNGGTVISVGLALPSSVFTVTGSPVSGTGTLTGSFISQTQHFVFAAPSGGNGVPTFRALVASDLPAGTGTVTSVAASTNTISGLTVSGSPITTSGTLAFILGQSTTSTNGYLSSADWNTFNGKQNALTFGDLTDAGTDGITITGGTGAVIGSGTSISQHVADATHNGYLSSSDWSAFNAKQPAGSYITALTGDVTASGPGSAAATLATVNSNVGTFAAVTVNGKGLVTAATALSGDATTSGAALTLNTVNSNVGTFASVTVNGKGLVTAATALSGDATTSGAALTLATVNSDVGTFGDSTHIPTFTVNGKGLITAASQTSIAPYYISTVLTTRVTTTPTNPGEYRTYIQDAAAATGSDNAPTSAPSSSNGMRLYSVPWASAGTSGQTNRWEIFVGVGKRLQFEFYQTTNRTGAISYDYTYYGTTFLAGTLVGYDEANGLAYVDAIQQASTVTNRNVGYKNNAGGAAYVETTDCYFDILITD